MQKPPISAVVNPALISFGALHSDNDLRNAERKFRITSDSLQEHGRCLAAALRRQEFRPEPMRGRDLTSFALGIAARCNDQHRVIEL
ncbi:hypothetical protein IE4803_PD00588 (plasmid) [Rhizobium etli bv. phaseoli str. IE4803]|nr:hypothetical protein IE4803_PD00588 [Rhizobium etli bv. phaseoli str. IE4803]